MKEHTMDKSKRKKLKKRDSAGFKESRVHSEKLAKYKHGATMPASISKANAEKPENSADREMRRMMGGEVFRSAGKSVNQSNVSKRRNK